MTSPCLDELACAQLSIRANYCADIHDMEGFVNLFTDDGVLELRGHSFAGRDAIMELMRGRPRDRITRHLLSCPVVDLIDQHSGRGVSFFTLLEANSSEAEGFPYPLHHPTSVAENHDEYRRTNDGWRISARKVVSIFRQNRD